LNEQSANRLPRSSTARTARSIAEWIKDVEETTAVMIQNIGNHDDEDFFSVNDSTVNTGYSTVLSKETLSSVVGRNESCDIYSIVEDSSFVPDGHGRWVSAKSYGAESVVELPSEPKNRVRSKYSRTHKDDKYLVHDTVLVDDLIGSYEDQYVLSDDDDSILRFNRRSRRY
jgi:hypothetical protein